MKLLPFILLLISVTGAARNAGAADPVFSGPQPGEKTTPFKVLEVTGTNAGKERDPVTEIAGAPAALVFVHNVERSLLPLLRVVDEYGAGRKDALKTEVVFLFGDRVAGEERLKAVAGSLKLHSPVSLSLDGAEGPGNFGLNKECMMTIVVAKDNKVTANFALVQPGIADAPKVIEALAKVSGDTAPATVEQLTGRHMARTGGGGRMDREGMRPERGRGQSADFTQFDLNSEAGLRDAVRALMAEVQALRAELAALRGQRGAPEQNAPASQRREEFPGAVPDDAKLNQLLRQFIRPTNDDATVDKLMAEIEAYIKDDAGLTRQALDGWTRVLHFGDHYGTAYSRKVGQAFLDKLKAAAPPPK
jgi:hypothetical protein